MSGFKRFSDRPRVGSRRDLAVAVVILGAALLACKKGKKEETESTASTAVAEIGIPECDEFLKKYEKCVAEKYPEVARTQAKQSIVTMRNTWRQAAANPLTKPALASGCKQAASTTQQSTAAFGCEW